MCRIALAALLCLASAAAVAEELDYNVVKTLPCRTYVASYGTQLLGFLDNPIVDYISKHGKPAEDFGSTCNIGDYVQTVCKGHGAFTVGQATAYLLRLQSQKKPLPQIPRCGA